MKKTFLPFVLLLISTTIFGGNIYVSTSGNDENTGSDPTNALGTIQKAVELAVAGDVINIAAGTYTETHIGLDKDITIIGENAETTIVQAIGTKPDGTNLVKDKNIFHMVNSANVTIKMLTIRHGYNSEAGGAIGVFLGQTLTLESCNIVDNYTLLGGGAIANWGNLNIKGCYVAYNTAKTNGGAIMTLGGSLQIENSVIYNNVAYGTTNTNSSGAGACYVGASKAKLYNNTIAYNSCATDGNKNFGIRIEGATGTEFEIYNNIFCNSTTNAWATGVDVTLNNTIYAPVAAKNKNNMYTFVYSVVLNSTTIPVPATPQTGTFPTVAQIAFGALAQNNYGVYYLPILESSVAKDAADVSTSLTTDIKGITRGTTPDIGAYEWEANTPTQIVYANSEKFICPSISNGNFLFTNYSDKEGMLEVYTISGKKIYTHSVNTGITSISLPDYTSGVVVLSFTCNQGLFTTKHVVIK